VRAVAAELAEDQNLVADRAKGHYAGRAADVQPAVDRVFSRQAQDSRAWFKPMGDDKDVWYGKRQNMLDAVVAEDAALKTRRPCGSTR